MPTTVLSSTAQPVGPCSLQYKRMKFDVQKIFEETRRSAREYTQQIASKWFSAMIGDAHCFVVNQMEICVPLV